MGEKFNLTWHTFSSHGQELFKDLLESQEFSDVTLISDDQHQYRVHKFILSACSTVFRNILTSSPHNSSIYLRGINHEELDSILQFIYLGEATLYHERMNEFLIVAKSLDIKEIGKNVVDEEDESGVPNDIQRIKKDNSIQVEEFPTLERAASEALKNDSSSIHSYHTIIAYKCQQCNYQATRKDDLNRHIQSVHKGIKQHSCQQCDYQVARADSLQIHIESIHEGIRYPCHQCEYTATQRSNLQKHIMSKHDSIKQFTCQHCDYQAARVDSLRMHVVSIHEGIKYPCHQCEYKATQRSNLQKHIKRKHGF